MRKNNKFLRRFWILTNYRDYINNAIFINPDPDPIAPKILDDR